MVLELLTTEQVKLGITWHVLSHPSYGTPIGLSHGKTQVMLSPHTSVQSKL